VLPRIQCALVVAAVLVTACGGPDVSSFSAACSSFASTVCKKAQACGATNDTSSCTSQLQDRLGCARAVCPAGSTYDSKAASDCINGIDSLSCDDAATALANNTLPSACNSVCR